MSFILDLFLQLRIRTRIILLCVCYSFCIVIAAVTGRLFTPALAVVSTIVFVLLGIFFSGLLFWSVNNALQRIISYLATMGAGDLTQVIAAKRNNEISTIIRSINDLQTTMRDIIAQISQTSGQVALTSGQLLANAKQIASGTDHAATQTNSVALASEEMAGTSNDIAHNCQSAAGNSNRASETARAGAEVVRQTTGGMERIASRVKDAAQTVEKLGAKSDEIGAIIGTIEDIADQTNLLALNAAIEAARAGEQGRGFAVVADEVRALAERTTRATREIGAMIKDIQKETKGAVAAMEEGVSEVAKGAEYSVGSGQALEMIINQVNEVTAQVNQIVIAAEQQTSTTAAITGNIQNITDVFQQTSRGVSDTVSAAATLTGQSEELQRLVRQFKL
jgi:methyl-accepting chemotaxis protein